VDSKDSILAVYLVAYCCCKWIEFISRNVWGTWWKSWLRHCATIREVMGSNSWCGRWDFSFT